MHGLYGIGAVIGKHDIFIPVWQAAGLTVWYQDGKFLSTTLPVTVEWDIFILPMGNYVLGAAIGRMAKDAAALAEE